MSLSTSLLFGQSNKTTRDASESLPRLAPRTDLQWGRHIFHAPEPLCPRLRLEDLRLATDFRNTAKAQR